MAIKLAINGFGRIGRLSFRRAVETGEFEVVAINDLTDAATLTYLLKYDTTHRRFGGDDLHVSEDGKGIVYKGKFIPVIGQPDPNLIKWSDYGVDIVLECTGRFKGKADAAVHVDVGGAKGVIISAPADAETPTIVYGVNENILTKDMKVISGASCTTNCLAPVVKVLHDEIGIEGGFMTTVHAYTNDQTTLDLVKKGDLRRGRAAAANIVPSSTGAAKAIHLVIPALKGRLQGGALRVPVIDGSLVDLSLNLAKPTSDKEINALMKKYANGALKDVLAYTEDQIVSSDIIGAVEGSIFDATQTKVFATPEGKQLVKVVAWYDNEYSYTCQYIRLAKAYADVLGI
ncbi:MAG TPA: type I glyceraldehyde-3-phosphate dehydrogenase [Bacilli bacterium]|jgi:glyceraldehyde 3-phosphate dehydrogenase|nr:type I glyceraldehyde-3-phosphate dehydrogenase [Bacilli bacterium]